MHCDPKKIFGAEQSGHPLGWNSMDNLPITRLGLHTPIPFFFLLPSDPCYLLTSCIYFPELLLWFFINDADCPAHPITSIIKDDSGVHYGLSLLSLCILYAHFNEHVIPNRIFLQMGSWTHCATLSDGKKCLVRLNYLNHWPQCPMRTLLLYDIPGGIFPLQACRHFKSLWELYSQSAHWSMTSKCCSNSFYQC